jgi:hypothetical protein
LLWVRFVLSLWLSAVSGCGAACLLLSFNLTGGSGDKDLELVVALSSAASVMTFGFMLLWKLRDSLKDILFAQKTEFSPNKMHAVLVLMLTTGLFSNLYVVEESRLLNFCLQSAVAGFVFFLRGSKTAASSGFSLLASVKKLFVT